MRETAHTSLKVAVGIATVNRPAVLSAAMAQLAQQTRAPDQIVLAASTEADLGGIEADSTITILLGAKGLTAQRNRIICSVIDYDLLVFFDDDFLADPHYLDSIERIFALEEDVVMTTGHVLADGIIGPGIDIETGTAYLCDQKDKPSTRQYEVYNGYGCNMAVRMAAIRIYRIFFDENLPLYGWLEDVDFSRRLAEHGRIVKTEAARGIHLGIKSGRQSGLRTGYSQVANPIYLIRKGSYDWSPALFLMSRNLAMNCLRSLRPEPYVDRAGRVAGNARAFVDLFRGRLHPTRVQTL